MNNKQIWIGLFISGMLLGAAIALVTLFLSARMNPESPLPLVIQAPDAQEAQIGIAVPRRELFPSRKDLCAVVTLQDLNSLISGINAIRAEKDPLPPLTERDVDRPFSSCAYFGSREEVPIILLKDSFYSLETNKILQEQSGLVVRDLTGVGDGAFLVAYPQVPGVDLSALTIYFQAGEFTYGVDSFGLTENQIRSVANFTANRLR